jgi:Family of unknown function (DUF7002)
MVKGITIDELSSRFPRLYHMAAQGSWPGIERYGLLSTSALLDLFEVRGAHREEIESHHRPESVTISHVKVGTAVIRDQKPMHDAGLRRALADGLAPQDWYRILNEKVFFWLTRDRLTRMLNAKAYRDKRQTVIVLDTRSLLERHSEKAILSPMNSGCTKPFPHARGKKTFLPLREYPFSERLSRGLEPVVELAVAHGVEDVSELALRIEEVGGGLPTKVFRLERASGR